ncbi:Arylamine N-acetyltransferase 2 [Talaromyces pinophilus]|nr:Arylamine N-acetyltransferase 2 [Talaromyces pinophilus]
MATYTPSQLSQYFSHISYPKPQHPSDPLQFLTGLQRHQLLRVPFESLSLHYSRSRTISLDPQALFTKIVTGSRGGYCLENNTFFGEILKSLGFQVYAVICRIGNASRGVYDGGWRGMSHMANLVIIDDRKYLVDVGYGADGPTCPLPLKSGHISSPEPFKLDHKHVPQHTDAGQMVWVYSRLKTRDNNIAWTEIYHFSEVETFAADLEVLNYWNMARSLFAQAVVAQRFTQTEPGEMRSYVLFRDLLKYRVGETEEMIEVFQNEGQRVKALVKYFQISLTQEEILAIQGTQSALSTV